MLTLKNDVDISQLRSKNFNYDVINKTYKRFIRNYVYIVISEKTREICVYSPMGLTDYNRYKDEIKEIIGDMID
jgi:hypothetical protein